MDCENQKKAIFVGPWGSPGGSRFDDGSHSGVGQIVLKHGGCIDSIEILYVKDGNLVGSVKHGGEGGHNRSEVKLFANEYLTGISGHHGTFSDQPVIRSLTFTSDMKTYGPFGEEKETPFSFQMEGGKIVGFRGSSGTYLENIGCYIIQS